MKTVIENNKRYILPVYFKGAPNSSVRIEIELRVVKNQNHKDFGKVGIYSDSFYEPIYNFNTNKGKVTIKEAIAFVERLGAIAVKDDFDFYSIDDLKEIKQSLSKEWIEGFNTNQL